MLGLQSAGGTLLLGLLYGLETRLQRSLQPDLDDCQPLCWSIAGKRRISSATNQTA